MFNLLRLDSILLGAAQKFCDKFQQLTGFTKFRIEKWIIIIALMSYWMFAIEMTSLFLGAVSLILSVEYFFVVRDIESQEKAFLARNELQYNIHHNHGTRIICLASYGIMLLPAIVLTCLEIEFLWLCMWLVSVLAGVYFSACVPRPPSKSKMREWYEKALTALNDSLKPEPALVPIPVPSR